MKELNCICVWLVRRTQIKQDQVVLNINCKLYERTFEIWNFPAENFPPRSTRYNNFTNNYNNFTKGGGGYNNFTIF